MKKFLFMGVFILMFFVSPQAKSTNTLSNPLVFLQTNGTQIPSYLRQGIRVDKITLDKAIQLYKDGWRYTMPRPKSPQAAWGNSDGRTTWWFGYWHNVKTGKYSSTVPQKLSDGKYVGDGINNNYTWRRGGSPSRPTKLEWLLSSYGGITPY